MGQIIRQFKNLAHWLIGAGWVMRYGYPAKSMVVIGVTGTDGKTTTTTLIYEMLMAAGYKVGMISTVAARIGEEKLDMALHVTNPKAEVLQGLLRKMVDAGCTHAVIEVTSHGLDQHRTVGCNFQIGVLTNVSHEHLDYHGTMEKYVEAKARLFKGTKWAVLNKDEEWAQKIAKTVGGEVVWYGKSKTRKVGQGLGGEYNRYNIGATEAVGKLLEIKAETVEKVVGEFGGVPGRREEVVAGQSFRCVVDFAHTPNALEKLLKSLREETQGKVLVVFGCTGERDRAKRPVMGEVAERMADVVIVTSDDVRGENQDEIFANIVSGMKNPSKVIKENDRDEAIEIAVKMAKKGDVVVAAGMGHETTQLIGKTELQRSDRRAFEKAVASMLR